MKKVLIISFFFNNKEEIGSVRLRGLAKYLPEYGWEPTILTIKMDNKSESGFKTVETEYSDLVANWESKLGLNSENIKLKSKKNHENFTGFLIKAWLELFAYPDPEKNWYKPAVEAGNELLENEHFDAILSSSSPVTCHLIANELKKRYNMPWIADLRDLWSQNPYYNYSFIRNYFEKRLEINNLKNADILTTVSEPLENELRKIHEYKLIYTIYNGFDPTKVNEGELLTRKLTITYTGRLYQGKRDPEILFKALSELISEEKINIKDFSINFYGNVEGWLIEDIKRYDLENSVNIYGLIPKEDVLKRQSQSQILLLLTWYDPKEFGTTTGKLFEYLAAKRPILSIGPSKGVVKNIITSTNSGVHLSDISEIKDQIQYYYREYLKNRRIEYHGFQRELEKYSQVKMAKKFSKVLNRTTNL